MKKSKLLISLIVALSSFSVTLKAQAMQNENVTLSPKEKSLIAIASSTAKGNLLKLKTALNAGLEAGWTINQIKEAIVHIYAYAGFPRSIRGLQTFMMVLDERKSKGINDAIGIEASPLNGDSSKYERGKAVLEKLTGVPETGAKTGYAAFAPLIEIFLKEHLFADIFERDILTYAERELVTVSVLSSIGGVEPMLQSHLKICLNVGLTAGQLHQLVAVIKTTAGEKEAIAAQKVLSDVLKDSKKITRMSSIDKVFPQGNIITNDNFSGNAWLNMLVESDTTYSTQIGNVTFEPGARTRWHYHPGGQILLVIEGKGLYQEKGKPIQVIKKGDVIKCSPNTIHWHGATPTDPMVHIAIGTNTGKGSVVWLEKVSDAVYRSIKEYGVQKSSAQSSVSIAEQQQEVMRLSKTKWLWMADRNTDSLNGLFDERAVFVHMGGTWGKSNELDVIKSGRIWYKNAEVYSASVNIFDNTAILLNDIDLVAVVGGNEVSNPFMVTEVYIKENGRWKMGSLTFSHLLRPLKLNNSNQPQH